MEKATLISVLVIAAAVVFPLLTLVWISQLGLTRGLLAGLCRIGWVTPLFLCLFPETTSEPLPRALSLKPVQVLLDDSQSMSAGQMGPQLPIALQELVTQLEADCLRLGCSPKVLRLSDLAADTKRGYTPLGRVLEPWLYKAGGEPWVLVSDGGDSEPREAWAANLKQVGRPRAVGEPTQGLILGFKTDELPNVWLKQASIAPFSFVDKPLAVNVQIARSGKRLEAERIQLQVVAEAQSLATVNATFLPNEQETSVTVMLPALPRGQQLLAIKALPTAAEKTLWDNTTYAQVEVLPNTVGVLHLLGSPSWDGRFVRRYLKAEPKYDLISFFILRDPWDSQQVNEREMSLIPFPVERLFKEELQNFRVLIIQNFTLFQFLLPEYQQNLVRFVQDGGSLLFIGGPRALQPADLSNSPLSAILPFDLNQIAGVPTAGRPFLGALTGDLSGDEPAAVVDPNGPAYDEQLRFRVQLAQPTPEKRALANIFDDWEQLKTELTSWESARGLHHMERVKFKSDVTTPLLNARTPQGTDIPLAVASYPGKGRAIWFFSDSLWRLAMHMREATSRQVYNQFLEAAMTWLMRQEMRKSLVVTRFDLRRGPAANFADVAPRFGEWSAHLQGSALRYLQAGDAAANWQLRLCGQSLSIKDLTSRQLGAEELELSGELSAGLAGGERCTLDLEARHPAFGSVKTQITGVMPETYKDDDIGGAPQKLVELAKLTGATLSMPPDPPDEALGAWLERITGQEGVALPNRFRTTQNYFWVLNKFWFWILLLLLPVEVLVRRWEQLVGHRQVAAEKEF